MQTNNQQNLNAENLSRPFNPTAGCLWKSRTPADARQPTSAVQWRQNAWDINNNYIICCLEFNQTCQLYDKCVFWANTGYGSRCSLHQINASVTVEDKASFETKASFGWTAKESCLISNLDTVVLPYCFCWRWHTLPLVTGLLWAILAEIRHIYSTVRQKTNETANATHGTTA